VVARDHGYGAPVEHHLILWRETAPADFDPGTGHSVVRHHALNHRGDIDRKIADHQIGSARFSQNDLSVLITARNLKCDFELAHSAGAHQLVTEVERGTIGKTRATNHDLGAD